MDKALVREKVREQRSLLAQRAAYLLDTGEVEGALYVAEAAALLGREGLEYLLSLGTKPLVEEARRLVPLARKPLRRPPPWGWGFMREVSAGAKGLSPKATEAVSYLAHRAPMYQALLAWGLWRLWGREDPVRFLRNLDRLLAATRR